MPERRRRGPAGPCRESHCDVRLRPEPGALPARRSCGSARRCAGSPARGWSRPTGHRTPPGSPSRRTAAGPHRSVPGARRPRRAGRRGTGPGPGPRCRAHADPGRLPSPARPRAPDIPRVAVAARRPRRAPARGPGSHADGWPGRTRSQALGASDWSSASSEGRPSRSSRSSSSARITGSPRSCPAGGPAPPRAGTGRCRRPGSRAVPASAIPASAARA